MSQTGHSATMADHGRNVLCKARRTHIDEHDCLDISHPAQRQAVLEHGTTKRMFLYFRTQKTEIVCLFDYTNTSLIRMLYYRESTARPSHNLALSWNFCKAGRPT